MQATIGRTSSFESKLRQAVKYSLEEIKLAGSKCSCRTPVAGGCRTCMRKEISVRLQNVGYNCVICKSKWKSSSEIPAGIYIYNFNSFQSWNSLIGIKIDFVLMFFPRKSHLFRSGGKIEERRCDQGGD